METMKKKLKNILPILALIFSAILALSGILISALSMRDRAIVLEELAEYQRKTYVLTDELTEINMKYTGYGVILQGALTYDDGGAEDPIFGVRADSAMLVRISEMFQWVKDGDGYKQEWSEELIDTGDDSHKNPTQYPLQSSSGFYSAHAVRVGPYKISDDLLAQLPSRAALDTLPDINADGFRTAGKYITNAADIDAPKIGDVRIRYEYMTAKEVTVSGTQRNGGIEIWYSVGTNHEIYRIFEGIVSQGDVMAAYRRDAAPPVYWMLLLGIAAAVGGSALFMMSFMKFFGYTPKIKLTLGSAAGKKKRAGGRSKAGVNDKNGKNGKNGEKDKPAGQKKLTLEGVGAGLVFAAVTGALFVFLGASSAFIQTAALWLLAAIVLTIAFLAFILIPNMRKYTPERKKDDYYEPILRHRDEFDRRD